LPDQLLVRYFRAGEIEAIASVTVKEDKVGVHLKLAGTPRFDHWRDLGGGLGFVPDLD
jgi:DNA transposition AAA+ family ATPase